MNTEETAPGKHFIRQIIERDVRSGKWSGRVVTRFPPEPNGYLHIGHAKSVCLNFGMAAEYGGTCHLRMDDTNPVKEELEYVEAIKEDVRWLGFDWGEHFHYASDYFEQMYKYAVELIRQGNAYVCALSSEEWKDYRGIPEKPGMESPHRNRPVDENLELFSMMRAGEFPDGAMVLRAKIDMGSPNLHMRDPVLYRILKAKHPHTDGVWCIYPTYDFAHCLEDSIEGITHSLCTLEFEVHRPLYDWILDKLGIHHPQQIEFARLNMTYTVMSKRKLINLINEGYVDGWDDPRLPTVRGMRRRGVTPASIRNFCERIGVTKYDSLTDTALLEHFIRDDLNRHATRALAVLNPVKLIIENYPEDEEEEFDAVNNPESPDAGTRKIPFGRELYIEREDFMEDPPKKYYRLAPGREVRLRYACLITCTGVKKDEVSGEIEKIYCRWDPDSRGGGAPDGRKVKGTIHWVSARHAGEADVRLYDRLFNVEEPGADNGEDYLTHINQDSLRTVKAKVEPSLMNAAAGSHIQFERLGYFYADHVNSKPGKPVFNRTATLRDQWAKKGQ